MGYGRWVIAAAGTLLMTLIGTLYSWGIFTQPLLAAFHWNVATITWAYAVANFSLAVIGAMLGGVWQDRVGPRPVALTGIALWATGNVLAGLGMQTLGAPWLYLTYGLIGGVGAGMAYVTPLATVSKWFPDRPGVAGGVVAGGFGLGAVLYYQWVPRWEAFRLAGEHASALTAVHGAAGELSPTDVHAILKVFVLSGLTFLAVGLPAAAVLRNPPPGYAVGARGRGLAPWGLPPSQVLRTPRFYLLWLQLFANVIAGVTIISNAVMILVELTGLPPEALAPLFGTVSVCNAAGRVLWGWIADRIGCCQSFMAMCAIQVACLLWLTRVHGITQALTAVAVLLLCCGGSFGVMPAYTLRTFGSLHVGRNYGMLLSAWGTAGVLGPILTALLRDVTGSFSGMMPVIAGLLVVTMALPLLSGALSHGAAELDSRWQHNPELGIAIATTGEVTGPASQELHDVLEAYAALYGYHLLYQDALVRAHCAPSELCSPKLASMTAYETTETVFMAPVDTLERDLSQLLAGTGLTYELDHEKKLLTLVEKDRVIAGTTSPSPMTATGSAAEDVLSHDVASTNDQAVSWDLTLHLNSQSNFNHKEGECDALSRVQEDLSFRCPPPAWRLANYLMPGTRISSGSRPALGTTSPPIVNVPTNLESEKQHAETTATVKLGQDVPKAPHCADVLSLDKFCGPGDLSGSIGATLPHIEHRLGSSFPMLLVRPVSTDYSLRSLPTDVEDGWWRVNIAGTDLTNNAQCSVEV